MDWRDRLAMWRMDWFPFRVTEYLGHTDVPLQWSEGSRK